MNRLFLASAVMFFTTTGFAFTVDAQNSKVTWTGAKVVGSTHTGNVKIKNVDLKWKKGEPSTGKVVIDMTTITNTDLKDSKYNKKLVGHLKSDDFFGVSKHKSAILDVQKVKKLSKNTYKLTGQLEIKGTKRPVTVNAEVKSSTKTNKTVVAKFKFDRTEFGIKYGSGKFFEDLGDKMISDEVDVAVELQFTADKES